MRRIRDDDVPGWMMPPIRGWDGQERKSRIGANEANGPRIEMVSPQDFHATDTGDLHAATNEPNFAVSSTRRPTWTPDAWTVHHHGHGQLLRRRLGRRLGDLDRLVEDGAVLAGGLGCFCMAWIWMAWSRPLRIVSVVSSTWALGGAWKANSSGGSSGSIWTFGVDQLDLARLDLLDRARASRSGGRRGRSAGCPGGSWGPCRPGSIL